MGVNLAFLYIRASSVLLVVVLMFTCRFAFLVVVILMLAFIVRSTFGQFILVVLETFFHQGVVFIRWFIRF